MLRGMCGRGAEPAMTNKPGRGNLTVMGEDIILETEELTKEFAGFVAVGGVNLRSGPIRRAATASKIVITREEIDRFGLGEDGQPNLLSSKADFGRRTRSASGHSRWGKV